MESMNTWPYIPLFYILQRLYNATYDYFVPYIEESVQTCASLQP